MLVVNRGWLGYLREKREAMIVRVKMTSVRKPAWFSQARPWRGRGAWGPCAMGVPHNGEAVRCGHGGFSKRWKRS